MEIKFKDDEMGKVSDSDIWPKSQEEKWPHLGHSKLRTKILSPYCAQNGINSMVKAENYDNSKLLVTSALRNRSRNPSVLDTDFCSPQTNRTCSSCVCL